MAKVVPANCSLGWLWHLLIVFSTCTLFSFIIFIIVVVTLLAMATDMYVELSLKKNGPVLHTKPIQSTKKVLLPIQIASCEGKKRICTA